MCTSVCVCYECVSVCMWHTLSQICMHKDAHHCLHVTAKCRQTLMCANFCNEPE